jgi:hypothetical protein
VATQVIQCYNDRRRRPSIISRGEGVGNGGRYSPVNTEENAEKKVTGNNRRDHDLEETVHSDSSKPVWGTGTKKRRAAISPLSSDSFS